MRNSLSSLSGLALVATACLSPGGQAADPRLIEKRQSNGFNQPSSWLTVSGNFLAVVDVFLPQQFTDYGSLPASSYRQFLGLTSESP